jgi:hypothetical protein
MLVQISSAPVAQIRAYSSSFRLGSTTLSEQEAEKKDKPKWNVVKGQATKPDRKTGPSEPKFVNTTPKGAKKDISSSPMEEGCACERYSLYRVVKSV